MNSHAVESHEDHPHEDHPHVDTSPWPPIAGIGALILFVSFVLLIAGNKGLGYPVLIVGTLVTVAASIGWWAAIVKEQLPGPPPVGHPGQPNDFTLGWILFIASEAMFFSAFFGFYFFVRMQAPVWPPEGVPLPVHSMTLPWIMTVVLVTSALTYTWAEWGLVRNKRGIVILGMLITVLLGFAFLGMQAYEWSTSELKLTDGLLGTAFFMITGFHGLHVLVGALFILVNLVRSMMGHFTPRRHFAVQAAGWYWHFVDVIWIFLIFAVYLPTVAGH